MNWLTTFFRTGRRPKQLLNMIGIRQRNNTARNSVVLSLLGAGIGAAAFGMLRGAGRNNATNGMMQPVKQAMSQIRNPVS